MDVSTARRPRPTPASDQDTAAVEVTDLVKRYPKRPVNAVDGITFHVERGEIFGLLGPNGAGKTTTVGILTTRVRSTSGTARVVGIDVSRQPVEVRSKLSVVPQRVSLDRSLTARQNLVFHAAYHGVPSAERHRRADALLAQFGLGDRGGDKIDSYSGGMVQRLLICRALMHAPEVLFLDEPTTGLDPQARLFVWDRIRELRAAGVTILLTTHDMSEASELTDRVGIMDHGKLLALDTPEALTKALPGNQTLDLVVELAERDAPAALIEALGALDGVERIEQVATAPAGFGGGFGGGFPGMPGPGGPGGGAPPRAGAPPGAPPAPAGRDLRIRLYLAGEAALAIGPVTQQLAERGARLTAVNLGELDLEDVFIQLTGRELR